MIPPEPGSSLLHITTPDAWDAGALTPPPGGFLHLCTAIQLPYVLSRHFAGRRNLVILHLHPVPPDQLRWETSEPGMDPFPHLYGPLETDMVARAQKLD